MKNLKFNIAILFFTFYFLSSTFTPTVSAHVLQSDGSIGAVMHTDPDDDPIAGQPTSLFFDIKDKDNKFSLTECNCRVDIYEGGKLIYSDALSAVFQYNFPSKDIYQVHLIGSPQNRGAFQAFNISYDVRVARESGSDAATNGNWLTAHLYLVLGIGLIGFILGLPVAGKLIRRK